MTPRLSTIASAAALAVALVFISGEVSAQAPAAKKAWSAPKTPDGVPDLQGIWTNVTVTPLERPRDLADKAFFTAQEARAYAARIVDQGNADKRSSNPEQDVGTAYNAFWYDRGTSVVPTLRTSIVV